MNLGEPNLKLTSLVGTYIHMYGSMSVMTFLHITIKLILTITSTINTAIMIAIVVKETIIILIINTINLPITKQRTIAVKRVVIIILKTPTSIRMKINDNDYNIFR